ncbi:MAG: ParB/RepB/Spo0J family partition protein [Lachnospiraceae bacterium]|nr:ParB/RepB/Spo0J family partition protein [Lachnospiraceae bacterium]
MKSRSGEKIKLTSYDELLGVDIQESCIEVQLSELHNFKNHPFKVKDDKKMEELVESIKLNGVLSPALVRSRNEGGYELISGHRRKHAAEMAGVERIPVIVKELTDDESIIIMVDSNIQREEILPSEKAFAFKMKHDALLHRGKSLGHDVQKWSHEQVGESNGISGRQVQRYMRLTELIPEILDMIDEKKLQLVCGVELSYLEKQVQEWIMNCILCKGASCPKLEHIVNLRRQAEKETLTQSLVEYILNENMEKQTATKITLPEKKLISYFPSGYSTKDMEQIIYSLLEKWKSENEGE